ncbi:MAG: leucine-rich repeat domain-containing protein, partial [Acholeplasmatales bacterium]|nr:leucine-rich repeat domain-containing protein [Acholeplasmatales bacterium]
IRRSYSIVFKNYDLTQLQNTEVEYGTLPVYQGETPTKPSTEQFHYEFSGWETELTSVVGEASYIAVFNSVLNKFEVIFKDYDEEVIDTQLIEYGSSAVSPSIPNSREYYSFKNWSTDYSNITANIIVYAVYSYAFEYNIVSNEVEIYLYHDCGLVSIEVPANLEGYPVTKILATTFTGHLPITTIYVPSSVTLIESGAFTGLDSLVNITIPFVGLSAAVTSNSFFGYIFGDSSYNPTTTKVPSSIRNVVISSSINVPDNAFNKCSFIKTITLSPSTVSIGDNAFRSCTALESVVIGSVLQSIGSYAFESCTSLQELNLPSSVTVIGYGVLRNCNSLVSLEIPFEGDKISEPLYTNFGFIFGTVDTLNQNNYIPASLTTVTLTNNPSIFAYSFYNCSNIVNINFASNTTVIFEYAFYGCSSLTQVNLPASLIGLTNNVFQNCTSITSVNIGPSLLEIGRYAFSGCTSLIELNIAFGVMEIREYAFYGDSSITYLNLPSSVYAIEQYAFSGLNLITTLEVPNSVTSIGLGAFQNCSSLLELSIPFVGRAETGDNRHYGYIFGIAYTGVMTGIPTHLTKVTVTKSTNFAYRAFGSITNIVELNIPDTTTYIDEYAFYNTRFPSFTFPSHLVHIGSLAFSSNDYLKSVSLPESLTQLGNSAFYSCRSLAHVDIPSSITNIGQAVFGDCIKLKKIVIPTSVTTIHANAFYFLGDSDVTIFTNFSTKPAGWGYTQNFVVYYNSTWFLNDGEPEPYL